MRFSSHDLSQKGVTLCVAALAAVVVAAAVVPGRAAAVLPASGAPAPRASLVGFACRRALDPAQRSVSVQAVMRPLPRTRGFAVRFSLLRRVGFSQPAAVVRAGDLGVWITPRDPGLGSRPGDVWRLEKTVVNLQAPATYAFRVAFRWTGAGDRVVGRAVETTRVCRQRELRPDLLVRALAVSPVIGDPRHDDYEALIANRGVTGAGPFEVLFAPGDSSSPSTDMISFLGAGQSRQLQFLGPVCDPAAPPTVTADAAAQVDDLDRANNAATAVCPAS
jgi:hypothetical protein